MKKVQFKSYDELPLMLSVKIFAHAIVELAGAEA